MTVRFSWGWVVICIMRWILKNKHCYLHFTTIRRYSHQGHFFTGPQSLAGRGQWRFQTASAITSSLFSPHMNIALRISVLTSHSQKRTKATIVSSAVRNYSYSLRSGCSTGRSIVEQITLGFGGYEDLVRSRIHIHERVLCRFMPHIALNVEALNF